MKFSARPVTESKSENPEETNGFLRRVMVEQLANEDFEFEFLVQLQADPASMPIEDPTVLWDESESPYQVVARIKIPAQEFDTPERHDFAEHLSFTPWHAIEDHRPLGGINRVRKAVYTRLSTLRHQLNDKPRREPNP